VNLPQSFAWLASSGCILDLSRTAASITLHTVATTLTAAWDCIVRVAIPRSHNI
jgi:hypothetical protein